MAGRQYTLREFKKVLKRNGYRHVRTKGSHQIFENKNGNIISINLNPNAMVVRRLIKENNLQ